MQLRNHGNRPSVSTKRVPHTCVYCHVHAPGHPVPCPAFLSLLSPRTAKAWPRSGGRVTHHRESSPSQRTFVCVLLGWVRPRFPAPFAWVHRTAPGRFRSAALYTGLAATLAGRRFWVHVHAGPKKPSHTPALASSSRLSSLREVCTSINYCFKSAFKGRAACLGAANGPGPCCCRIWTGFWSIVTDELARRLDTTEHPRKRPLHYMKVEHLCRLFGGAMGTDHARRFQTLLPLCRTVSGTTPCSLAQRQGFPTLTGDPSLQNLNTVSSAGLTSPLNSTK